MTRAWLHLVVKEGRELLASRAWWVLLAVIGPLVGVSFIAAVRTYAEASEGAVYGGAVAFSPLDGIWAPTFSAYELAAIFLVPFVAIRLVSGDRLSGALKLELQRPMPTVLRLLAKVLVLVAGVGAAGLAAIVSIVLWRSYGGSVYLPELASVGLGHLLNAGLTITVAMAAAAAAEHPSTAAIVTLALTVGGWAIEFLAAVHGGPWAAIAAHTPSAMVGQFQRGLVRLDILLSALALAGGALSVAAIWLPPGRGRRKRAGLTTVALLATIGVVAAASQATASWDLSENRRNSLPRSAEAALRQIAEPIAIEAHLAPRDPRRFDLDVQVVRKLRRIVPDLQVRYVARTSIGLFEQADAGYGDIHYEVGGRRQTTRITSAEAALNALFTLSGIAPDDEEDPPFHGHPLTAEPGGAAAAFYVVWPAVVLLVSIGVLRRPG
jgi:hypothetical protein